MAARSKPRRTRARRQRRGSHYEEISNEKYYSRIIARNRGAGALASALRSGGLRLRRQKSRTGAFQTRAEAAKSGVQRTGRKWRLQQLIDCWLVAYHLHRRRHPLGRSLRAMA